jgi:hypothetical protein
MKTLNFLFDEIFSMLRLSHQKTKIPRKIKNLKVLSHGARYDTPLFLKKNRGKKTFL